MKPFVCSLIFCLALALSGPAFAFEAGAAKVEITGPLGAPLNGYGDRLGRGAVGVHDPLFARALYLDDGNTKVFLVSLDLCVVDPGLRTQVLSMAPTMVPPENVILTATHTHNGQGGMISQQPFRFVSGRFMPDLLKSTAQSIAQSMHEAYNRRRRATIGYGSVAQNTLSKNRRHAGGPIDPQIGVLLVEDADGSTIGVAANMAAHPTSVPDSDHYAYSADYPGYYAAALEKGGPNGCVALFLNGAEGNQTISGPGNAEGWARTQAVGEALAAQVSELIGKIICGEKRLHVGFATPALPPTMASAFMPSRTTVQTLEVDGLLMSFFPGEPCVELALELRQQALARGFDAQFSVGLANDYLMYFVPRAIYPEFTYESACTVYGPSISDWFYGEFGKLMTRGEAALQPAVLDAKVNEVPGGVHLVLSGDAHARGVQQGRYFSQEIQTAYRERIAEPVDKGTLLPKSGAWALWPPWTNPAPLALPAMGMASHQRLRGVGDGVWRFMEGIAEGAGLPFDALWLLQNAAVIGRTEDTAPLFQTPLCTVCAAVGGKAGADALLVGRNLDWPLKERAVVTEVHPSGGMAYVTVGFAWNAGLFTGMNEAGLVVCLESDAGAPVPAEAEKHAGIEFALAEVLQTRTQVAEAAVDIAAHPLLAGHRVLLAGMTGKNAAEAVVVERGSEAEQRKPLDGLLFGTALRDAPEGSETAQRYQHMQEVLGPERIVSPEEMQRALTKPQEQLQGMARVWNENTRHSVVFAPKDRTVYVAFPGEDGNAGKFTAFKLEGTTP